MARGGPALSKVACIDGQNCNAVAGLYGDYNASLAFVISSEFLSVTLLYFRFGIFV